MCVQGVDVQCLCVLHFALHHAAGCALHRPTSRAIHRTELSLFSTSLFRWSFCFSSLELLCLCVKVVVKGPTPAGSFLSPPRQASFKPDSLATWQRAQWRHRRSRLLTGNQHPTTRTGSEGPTTRSRRCLRGRALSPARREEPLPQSGGRSRPPEAVRQSRCRGEGNAVGVPTSVSLGKALP